MSSTDVPTHTSKRIKIETDDGLLEYDIKLSGLKQLLTTLTECQYKIAGCIVNDYLKDIKEHERRCLYRILPCPVESKEDLCNDVLAMNLIKHVKEHHKSDCISTKENFLCLPIDLNEDIRLFKMLTIHEDILFCRLKKEKNTLQTSLLCIRNTNTNVICEISLMADDVKWSNHKIQIPSSDLGFNEHNEQSVVFDLEKLIQARNIFDSITVRIECNIAPQENIVQSQKFLEKIICSFCGDFLDIKYYECEKKHLHCDLCYVSRESLRKLCIPSQGNVDCCMRCDLPMTATKQCLTVINSLQNFKYPCQNQSLGCKQVIPRYTSKHELLCFYKVFNCAFDHCNFTGKYSEFISHIQKNHRNNIINTNVYHVTDINQKLHYMFAFGSIFLCKIVDNWTCAIEWISTSVLNQNFNFEVTFLYNYRKGISLKTHTKPRDYCVQTYNFKSAYNTIKKTACFKMYVKETSDVVSFKFTVLKI